LLPEFVPDLRLDSDPKSEPRHFAVHRVHCVSAAVTLRLARAYEIVSLLYLKSNVGDFLGCGHVLDSYFDAIPYGPSRIGAGQAKEARSDLAPLMMNR
jgi:hypothetical protein